MSHVGDNPRLRLLGFPTMAPTPDIVRGIQPAKVEGARRLTFAQRFLAGAELFDYASEITKAGIRVQNPGMTEFEVIDELRRRLALAGRLEPAGVMEPE